MKTLTFYLFLMIFTTYVFCQSPINKEIKLDKNCKLLDQFSVNDKGFVLITGRDFGKNIFLNVKYLNKDLEEDWNINIPLHYENGYFNYNFIYSPYSNYFYIIENTPIKSQTDPWAITNPSYITQIDYEGHIKSFELKDFLQDDGTQIAIVLNKDYFNFLFRNENKVILKRISHSDFSIKNIELQLQGEYSKKMSANKSFWHFEGQSEDKIYLVSKEYAGFTDNKDKTYKYYIASIDENGNVKENISINATLLDCYPESSYHLTVKGVWSSDYQTFYDGIKHDNLWVYVNSVGDISFDFKNQSIFVYGLMNRKYINASKPMQKDPSGFYIEKFDFQGNKKWQDVKDFDSDFSEKMGILPDSRFIYYDNNNPLCI